MNDIARQLRAQIASSTDPDRLERMAREAEAPTVHPQHSTRARAELARVTGSRPMHLRTVGPIGQAVGLDDASEAVA